MTLSKVRLRTREFNQASLLTSSDGSLVYWSTDLAGPQANTLDGLWKVLFDHDHSVTNGILHT